jgi:hypothetical protein
MPNLAADHGTVTLSLQNIDQIQLDMTVMIEDLVVGIP